MQRWVCLRVQEAAPWMPVGGCCCGNVVAWGVTGRHGAGCRGPRATVYLQGPHVLPVLVGAGTPGGCRAPWGLCRGWGSPGSGGGTDLAAHTPCTPQPTHTTPHGPAHPTPHSPHTPHPQPKHPTPHSPHTPRPVSCGLGSSNCSRTWVGPSAALQGPGPPAVWCSGFGAPVCGAPPRLAPPPGAGRPGLWGKTPMVPLVLPLRLNHLNLSPRPPPTGSKSRKRGRREGGLPEGLVSWSSVRDLESHHEPILLKN